MLSDERLAPNILPMSETSSTFNPWPLSLVILSADEALAVAYMKDVCGVEAEGSSNETVLNGKTVSVRILAGHPSLFPEWERDVRMADALVLLTRFLDRDSLDEVRQLFARMPAHGKQPLSVLYVRNEGEREFKMSCPACSQKLWVRDREAGHTGRCPNCERKFKTPSQAELLTTQLMLLSSISVVKVVQRNAASCRGPLLGLIDRLQSAEPSDGEVKASSKPEPVVISSATETAHIALEPASAQVPPPVIIPSEPDEPVRIPDDESDFVPLEAIPVEEPPTQRATVEEVASTTSKTLLQKKSTGPVKVRMKTTARKKIKIQMKKPPPAEE